MKGEKRAAPPPVYTKGVLRARAVSIPTFSVCQRHFCPRASPRAGPACLAVGSAAGHGRTCFSRAAPPSSVFILPPTLKGLFSGAGGGKVSSPLRVAAFCAASRPPATRRGSSLVTLCARGKRLASPRARACVHVGPTCMLMARLGWVG